MKGYGTKTFGQLNAERYDMIYEDLMLEETPDSVETLAELPTGVAEAISAPLSNTHFKERIYYRQ